MIKLSGLLTIKTIQGRYGAFTVGRLTTELGEFAVKNVLLEQYNQGKYEGEFGVSRIYPYSYVANGGVRVEIRANIDTIALTNIGKLTPEDEAIAEVDSDPLDDEVPTVKDTPAQLNIEQGVPTPVNTEHHSSPKSSGEADEESDSKLFGDLWPLSAKVKLDPTVSRALFRSQCERLGALNYEFKAIGQTWSKKCEPLC